MLTLNRSLNVGVFFGISLLLGFSSPVVWAQETHFDYAKLVEQAKLDQENAVQTIKRLQSSTQASASCEIEMATQQYQVADWFIQNQAKIEARIEEERTQLKRLQNHLVARLPKLDGLEVEVLLEPQQSTALAKATLPLKFGTDGSQARVSLKDAVQFVGIFNERMKSCSLDPAVREESAKAIRESLNNPLSNPLGLTLNQIEKALPLLAEALSASLRDDGFQYFLEYRTIENFELRQNCLSEVVLIQRALDVRGDSLSREFVIQYDANSRDIVINQSSRSELSGRQLSDREILQTLNDIGAELVGAQLNVYQSMDGFQRWVRAFDTLSGPCVSVLKSAGKWPALFASRRSFADLPYVSFASITSIAQKDQNSLRLRARSAPLKNDRFLIQSNPVSHHVLALLGSGELMGWGFNQYGNLGLQPTEVAGKLIFTPISIDSIRGGLIQKLMVGAHFNFAIMRDGRVLSWGDHGLGQLGIGPLPAAKDILFQPQEVPALSQKGVDQISLGHSHALALMKDGRLLAWGANENYQVDSSKQNVYTPQPISIFAGVNVKQVFAVGNSSFAVLSSGRVFAWGHNDLGQLGVGPSGLVSINPTEVTGLKGLPIDRLVGGWYHTLALLTDGRVFAWGGNGYSRLGLGAIRTDVKVPMLHPYFVENRAEDLAVGLNHGVALLKDGRVVTWGKNENCELGLGDHNNRDAPEEIIALRGLHVKRVMASSTTSYAVLEDGRVMAWGLGSYGAVGVGDSANHCLPAEVKGVRF